MMAFEKSGVIDSRGAFVLMRCAVIMRVRTLRRSMIAGVCIYGRLMRSTRMTGKSGKRGGQRLQGHQQQHEHRQFCPPGFHERVQCIETQIVTQPVVSDSMSVKKFYTKLRSPLVV